MAMKKMVEVDQIEVKGEYSIQVRTATKVMDDGKQIGSVGYHRHVVHPDSILEGQDAKVKKIAEALWGDEEKEAWFVFQNGHPSGVPADSWSKAQLQAYCSKHSVAWTDEHTKAQLLTKAKAKYEELNG
jgi:hypothetical protein